MQTLNLRCRAIRNRAFVGEKQKHGRLQSRPRQRWVRLPVEIDEGQGRPIGRTPGTTGNSQRHADRKQGSNRGTTQRAVGKQEFARLSVLIRVHS